MPTPEHEGATWNVFDVTRSIEFSQIHDILGWMQHDGRAGVL